MPELRDFLGLWRLSRVIEDARAGQVAQFEGRVVFTEAAGGLVQSEAGTLHLPGQPPMTATRRYLWRPGAARIAVFFEDGRFFHDIVPGPVPEATHDCPPDHYHVAYDFTGWPGWSNRWRVTGPRKNYTMTSHYRPHGPCDGAGYGAKLVRED